MYDFGIIAASQADTIRKNRWMTEAEIEELKSKSVEDHDPCPKQVRSVYDPVNENNKIKKQVGNTAAAPKTDIELVLKKSKFKSLKNW